MISLPFKHSNGQEIHEFYMVKGPHGHWRARMGRFSMRLILKSGYLKYSRENFSLEKFLNENYLRFSKNISMTSKIKGVTQTHLEAIFKLI